MATFLICAFIFVTIILPEWVMNAIDRYQNKKFEKEWRKKHGSDNNA